MKKTTIILNKIMIQTVSALTCLLVFSIACFALEPELKQVSFKTPEEAVISLMTSVKDGDNKKLMAILGPHAKPVLESGDAVEDKSNREKFVKAYAEANTLKRTNDAKRLLEIGKDGWEFPIPLVKKEDYWYFDTEAGKEEILNRRIGRNELSTIQAVLAYVDAQREYYLTNPQKDKVLSYSQKFLSTANQRDGLYYPVNEGESLSPLGELFANARAAGYSEKRADAAPQPFYGYYYRILKGQGENAPGGAYDYIVQGKMLAGHALIAWPASYGNSGVMTFLVNHEGRIYEKDLGLDTAQIAQQISKFNPDKTWQLLKKEEIQSFEGNEALP